MAISQVYHISDMTIIILVKKHNMGIKQILITEVGKIIKESFFPGQKRHPKTLLQEMSKVEQS